MIFGLTSWAGAETVDDLKKELEAAKQAIRVLESRLQAVRTVAETGSGRDNCGSGACARGGREGKTQGQL